MLVKDKHTQCYDEIIKNGSLTPTFFLFVPEKGGRFEIRDSKFEIRDSGFEILDSRFSILEIERVGLVVMCC
jgi:hypothetical protein